MPVLFQSPGFGYTLKPNKPAELLQGFVNIMTAENSQNGTLTQANLTSYGQKQFFAADPNSNVAGYLTQNFGQIAKLDGNANSISTDDLVQLRNGLPPVPPPSTQPPAQQPDQSQILLMMVSIMQLMMQLISGRTS